MNVSGSTITIPSIRLPDGSMSAPSVVDLASFEGKIVRLYVDITGAVHVNPDHDMYWQVAGLAVPSPAPADPMVPGSSPVAMDLSTVAITTFALPA